MNRSRGVETLSRGKYLHNDARHENMENGQEWLLKEK